MKKKIIFFIAVILLIISVTSSFEMFYEVSKSGFISEPSDFKPLFKKEKEFDIKHFITATYDEKYPFSGYRVSGYEYGVSVLRLPTNSKSVLSEAKFLSDKKTGQKMVQKTTVLGSFSLSRSDIKSVDELTIYIQKFKPRYTEFQSDSILYVTFILDRNFAIDFNSPKDIDIHLGVNPSEDLEKNELMILNKNGYLYFIHLRHYNKKVVEKSILEKIINIS